jgi:hypothetical protein
VRREPATDDGTLKVDLEGLGFEYPRRHFTFPLRSAGMKNLAHMHTAILDT